ncbi:RNA-binding S4 domain-containing protein [Azohydromonas sediminis]|uniref:RNA-binding S4 domain-containing protein n=1 Tax=Azohydromonas sediminis TaxID=2259674 RepID=UPI000E64D65C|nr:RNA-binding S4 domain-containing protein [Azohydromonas sediminis]
MVRPADAPRDTAADHGHPAGRVRLDKWLWAARWFKTRSLAADEVERGRVLVNGAPAKPARDVKPGDVLTIRQGDVRREVRVVALATVRGPAPVAQALYEETPASVQARREAAERRRQGVEPALAITHGRPTKHDRRELTRVKASWQRWSASLDGD